MIEFRASGLTDVGRARKHNEDCYEIDRDSRLFVVADGMGGHSHGEVASRIAVDAIREFVQRGSADGHSLETIPQFRDHSNRLRNAVRVAHGEVLRAINEDAALHGMGTTVVGLLVEEGTAALAHVGDSRAYRVRGGSLELLTQDHTWVHEQVRAGYLSEEQARHHPLKNVVTRALGSEKEVLVDLQEIQVEPGDVYLICSDGLTTMLDDNEILKILSKGRSLDETCRELIAEANSRGGLDNVTVILVAVEDGNGPLRSAKQDWAAEEEDEDGTLELAPAQIQDAGAAEDAGENGAGDSPSESVERLPSGGSDENGDPP